MRLKLFVTVLGHDTIIDTYESAVIKGKEAEAIRGVVNNIDNTGMLSFPQEHFGREVFLTRTVLDRCIVSCEVWDEDETTD